MMVVVEKVAVLGNQAGAGRPVVIRAEDGAQFGVVGELPGDPSQSIRVDDNVGIDERDDIAARHLDAAVAGVGGPMRCPRQANYQVGVGRRQLSGRVAAGIVNHDQLPAGPGQIARRQRRKAQRQDFSPVMRRYDDREQRTIRGYHRELPATSRSRSRRA